MTKKFNTVRNLITFSIVFTNKNGMDRFNYPPSPIKNTMFKKASLHLLTATDYNKNGHMKPCDQREHI